MRFELVTLFPEFLDTLKIGLLGKAVDQGLVTLDAINPREFATDKHRSVDDTPYGGGSGMVMMAPPVASALDALDERRVQPDGTPGCTKRILLTPQGQPFQQSMAERFALEPCLTLVCGRYEGFDDRIRGLVDEEVSLGDFVLLGGEMAALTLVEATARLVPGVLGNRESAVEESHSTGLLEYPQFTRPAEFRGVSVPPILLSGHHAKIERWRRKEALRRTMERRPDLIERAELSDDDRVLLRELQDERKTST